MKPLGEDVAASQVPLFSPVISGGLIEASTMAVAAAAGVWFSPVISGGLIEALAATKAVIDEFAFSPVISGGLIEATPPASDSTWGRCFPP